MSKHTPGPWRIYSEGSGFEVESESGVIVAQAQQTKPVRLGSDNDERRANAILIAAAPLMYEALEEIVNNAVKNYEGSMEICPEAIVAARAALQAAKGGDDGK